MRKLCWIALCSSFISFFEFHRIPKRQTFAQTDRLSEILKRRTRSLWRGQWNQIDNLLRKVERKYENSPFSIKSFAAKV